MRVIGLLAGAAIVNAVLIIPAAVLAGAPIKRLPHGGAVVAAPGVGAVQRRRGVVVSRRAGASGITPHLLGGLLLTGVGGVLAMLIDHRGGRLLRNSHRNRRTATGLRRTTIQEAMRQIGMWSATTSAQRR